MELSIIQRIDASPAAIWPLITLPRRMNEWSEAEIEHVESGDGGGTGDVGALRRVIIPGVVPTRLLETIRVSEPGSRLVYHVFRGPPALRTHRGEITLSPRDGHTELRWDVRFDFAIGGIDAIARRAVEPSLRRSIAKLAEVAASAPEIVLPACGTFASTTCLRPLRAEADRVLELQRTIAGELEARGDNKQWFARVYALVTEAQLLHLDTGEVDHPEWVLRLMPIFHRYYADNLARFRGQLPGECESPWRLAWSLAERSDPTKAPSDVVRALMLGVVAHIEEDLPRALAEVWIEHFRDRCDFARFRADYVRMGHVFRSASDQLLAQMPPTFVPRWLRAVRSALPPEFQDAMLARRYDVGARRLLAFERGRRLAAWSPQRS
jgi:hypothetical protein